MLKTHPPSHWERQRERERERERQRERKYKRAMMGHGVIKRWGAAQNQGRRSVSKGGQSALSSSSPSNSNCWQYLKCVIEKARNWYLWKIYVLGTWHRLFYLILTTHLFSRYCHRTLQKTLRFGLSKTTWCLHTPFPVSLIFVFLMSSFFFLSYFFCFKIIVPI